MSRSLVLGNGTLLVGLDEWGQVKDLFYPYVGLENHVGSGLTHKIGVWVDDRISWIDDGQWTVKSVYENDSMVSRITAHSADMELTLTFSDVVYNESSIFVRMVEVENHATHDREVRVFFNQQFHISESTLGDTAYFNADAHAVIHYRGRRLFLISGKTEEGNYFNDYSVGLLGISGHDGTWHDANDGVLTKNAIELGSVDSVIGFSLNLKGLGSKKLSYWVAVGEKHKDVMALHRDILTRGPEHLHRTTHDFWRAWVNKKEISFCGLDPALIALYKTSLFVIRAHTDNHGGIIASEDSSILQYGRDTYCYVWPRDASYAAHALLLAGYPDVSERLYSFCNDAITEEGFLLHKYRPDRSLGSSWHPWVRDGISQFPIQEDETAITLVTLWEHYLVTKDLEFIESLYNSYIRKAADFLVRYRHKETGLPLPSFDLWEERFGSFTYTNAAVYGALRAAANFASLLGKEVGAERWTEAAEEIQNSILTTLFDTEGYFIKSVSFTKGQVVADKTLDVSASYGVFRFGVLPADDARLISSFTKVRERLVRAEAGGVSRYEGDVYYRVDAGLPGNPWVFPTFWLAEYDIARAQTITELEAAVQPVFVWAQSHAVHAGMLPEQMNPYTGVPISALPLVWSHAGYVLLVQAYIEKLVALGGCPLPSAT